MKSKQLPWGMIALIAMLLVVWFSGGKDILSNVLAGLSITGPSSTQPQPTQQYQPAPADPSKNAPGKDFFDYVKSNVPADQRAKVRVLDLFALDLVHANQYFTLSTYIQANTEVNIVTAQRARAAASYASLVYPNNFLTRLFDKDGKVIKGTELATVISGDSFLIVGTTPGEALAGIEDIQTEFSETTGTTVTIVSRIPMKALYQGLAVADGTNKPQVEMQTVSTPSAFAQNFLLVRERLPNESDLNQIGVQAVAQQAMWLLLHKNGDQLWLDFKSSIEESNGGTSGYDLLAPYVTKAFCDKLDEYQKQLADEGKTLEIQSCYPTQVTSPADLVTIKVKFIAQKPINPDTKQEDVSYMLMSRSGAYVQLPDPNFSVHE
jgi:hypothetical protein